jgi:hypothetical protein
MLLDDLRPPQIIIRAVVFLQLLNGLHDGREIDGVDQDCAIAAGAMLSTALDQPT